MKSIGRPLNKSPKIERENESDHGDFYPEFLISPERFNALRERSKKKTIAKTRFVEEEKLEPPINKQAEKRRRSSPIAWNLISGVRRFSKYPVSKFMKFDTFKSKLGKEKDVLRQIKFTSKCSYANTSTISPESNQLAQTFKHRSNHKLLKELPNCNKKLNYRKILEITLVTKILLRWRSL
jgi:hypothetical protein